MISFFSQADIQPVLYTTTTTTTSSGISAFWIIAYLVFIVALVVAHWKIFEKAGEKGWKSLIPVWSTIVILRIVGFSPWFILLFLVPIVNFVFIVVVAYRVAKAFGYGVGMTILEFVFGIGALIIGFGESKYLGPDGQKSNTPKAKEA